MTNPQALTQAQEYMAQSGVDGWLLYDYRQSNPFFSQALGPLSMVTRPAFLFVPVEGNALLLAHHVDLGRFSHLEFRRVGYTGRASLLDHLRRILAGSKRVAMEYSPMGVIPRASRVDAGTIEMVRSAGVEVVSSADLVQYATQRWSQAQLQSHRRAADKLSRIAMEAFRYAGQRLGRGASELDVGDFIQRRFGEEGLDAGRPGGGGGLPQQRPSLSPHGETSSPIGAGSWVLIDLWAREPGPAGIFADITWVGYAGDDAPSRYRDAFDVVCGARDASLAFLQDAAHRGAQPQGWEVDRVARDYVSARGYGEYFTHRLGHSLDTEVHGEAVNLDGWETHDTRSVAPGIGVTIEPGVYLPGFGMRSEIDVYVSESGPEVTTAVQHEIVTIG